MMFDSVKPEQKPEKDAVGVFPKQKIQPVHTNSTGIPDAMKARYENQSKVSLDNVRIHYSSEKPAQFYALAYTRGNQVYIGPGQEKHLPHELGHVIQQKQGLVRPTRYIRGMPVNDNFSLEKAADASPAFLPNTELENSSVIQRKLPCTLFEYLQIYRSHPRVQETKIIKAYYQMILAPEIALLRSFQMETGIVFMNDSEVLEQSFEMLTETCEKKRDSATVQQLSLVVQKLQDNLESTINELSEHDAAPRTSYADDENTSLFSQSLKTDKSISRQIRQIYAAHPVAGRPALNPDQAENIVPDDSYRAGIPATLPFSEFRMRFRNMPGLLTLMLNIFLSWRTGKMMDRRSPEQVMAKSNTPDNPGAIRCVHTDTNPGGRVTGNLAFAVNPYAPVNMRRPALPDSTQAYEDHLTNHARYGADAMADPTAMDTQIRRTGKFLAEYTGIRLKSEPVPDKNKIVFDYLTGEMYVTFNHYHVMVKVNMLA